MKYKGNKGITLISLILTVIVILIITSALIFNAQDQIEMRKIQNLSIDIENLNAKVDEYFLKYGELPILCNYTSTEISNFKNRDDFEKSIQEKAEMQDAQLNSELNTKDGDEYIVIDLEKLGGLTLTYGYDREYEHLKETRNVLDFSGDAIEDEIFVINAKTHQIYFPHGVFVENVMYYTF
ncbi:MAG: hypothetical protein IJK18_08010 [Clostridia bacterium]|nr:hypothetical protein [Clostridia bacterium]